MSRMNVTDNARKAPISPVICPICPRSYTNSSARTRHVKSAHMSVRYACQFCGKELTRSGNRDNHMLGCTNSRAGNTSQSERLNSNEQAVELARTAAAAVHVPAVVGAHAKNVVPVVEKGLNIAAIRATNTPLAANAAVAIEATRTIDSKLLAQRSTAIDADKEQMRRAGYNPSHLSAHVRSLQLQRQVDGHAAALWPTHSRPMNRSAQRHQYGLVYKDFDPMLNSDAGVDDE